MHVPPTFIGARAPRHRRRREAPASPPPPPPAALEVTGVIDVNFAGDILNFTVVFNTTAEQPLEDPIAADPTKWTARYSDLLFQADTLVLVQYDQIQVGMFLVQSEAGANVVNYSNAPSDISDALGRMLGAFAGHPLP